MRTESKKKNLAVIPAYNEQETIRRVVSEVRKADGEIDVLPP